MLKSPILDHVSMRIVQMKEPFVHKADDHKLKAFLSQKTFKYTSAEYQDIPDQIQHS